MHGWAKKTETRWDDILVYAISGPFMIWVVILGLRLAVQTSELPEKVTDLIARSLLVLLVVSLMIVTSRLAGHFVKLYGGQIRGTLPVTSLTHNLLRLTVISIGSLILLDLFGISITPMLTALGVGGLAIALALQDTLSNLFAGFYISVAGHIRPGDYIKLDSGEEGYVTDITWRSTTIKTLGNNLIITPNAKLAQAIVTNYHLPERPMASRVQVGVSYDTDIEEVERILLEEAKKSIGEIPGLLAEPEPSVRFSPGFGASSLDFTLIFHVAEFDNQFLIQHELRKRIFKRFKSEGIEIPFPIQTVYMRKE
ncbi:MAG: mechanosensitive ion channel family protein [Anaerolineae bacterium]|nr:mechanosensitive ion channel family protein [Anaerolineae bacterium]